MSFDLSFGGISFYSQKNPAVTAGSPKLIAGVIYHTPPPALSGKDIVNYGPGPQPGMKAATIQYPYNWMYTAGYVARKNAADYKSKFSFLPKLALPKLPKVSPETFSVFDTPAKVKLIWWIGIGIAAIIFF